MTTEKGRKPISPDVVKGLTPRAERYIYWDPKLAGFGVRVAPSGTKTYLLRYRAHPGGRRAPLRLFVIGQHAEDLTPAQARARAVEAKARVKLGQDPQAEIAAGRAAITVAELCDRYFAEGANGKKASTIKLDKLRVRHHIVPEIGNRRASGVSKADLEKLMRDIEAGRLKTDSRHARGGPGAAARTIGLLSGVFAWAASANLLVNERGDGLPIPTKGIKRPADRKRDRLLSADELTALGASLTAEQATPTGRQFAMVFRLLLLTGARKNEIARLRWSEVDVAGRALNLADSKTGAKRVTLGAPAAAILADLHTSQDRGAWVFPDPRDPAQALRGLDWAWVRIRERAGLPDLRVHDLRHGFASVGAGGGMSLLVIGKLLGHADSRSTARYAHVAGDPLRDAADRISEHLAGALEGASAEVVQLRGGKS